MAARATAVWNWWFASLWLPRRVMPGGGRRSVTALLAACLLGGVPAVADTTVYRSVDERGVVTFSDEPPAGGSEASVLVFPESAPPADPAATLQALRETNDRMAQARRQREAARERASSGPRVGFTAPVKPGVAAPGLLPGPGLALWPYRMPPLSRPWRPPYARPSPVPPGFGILQPGNEQLMRPIVSSRN